MIAALPPAAPDQPFSPIPVAGGAPAYPADLAADGRPGRVNVTCQISAEGLPSGCRAAAGKGGSAFAAATLAWLAHGHVRYRPVVLHGHDVAGARTWSLGIEEPAAMLAEAKRKQIEAAKVEAAKAEQAAPLLAAASSTPRLVRLPVQPVMARQVIPAAPAAAIDRPFSTHVLTGGAPLFPASYDESRPGAVTVSCMIAEDGAAGGCRILKAVGGSAFGKSVQYWLGSGRVRFHPVTAGGRPVAQEESWTIVFNSVPVPQ